MSQDETNVTQESLPEADTRSVDEILADAINDEPASEGEKTPEAVVQPKPEPKTVPYTRFQEVIKENNTLKTSKIGTTNPMEVVKLAKALEGFDENEVDFITRNAGSSKIDDIIKASKDEWVKDAIDARRKRASDSKKVPGSSSPDFAQPTKNYRDIAKMSKDEFREYAAKQEGKGSTGI